MSALPRVAVVGIGGLFPGAASPRQLFDLVLSAQDSASEPPPGRWILPLDRAYRPGGPYPDRVHSRRACFLAPFECDLTGLDIDPAFVADLDPLFRLALRIGLDAWRSAVTHRVDRSRVGVVLGSIALPTQTTSERTRAFLAGDPEPHPINRRVTGFPATLLAKALGLGGGAMTLDAACASSLVAIKLAVDQLQAGRADAMLAGGLSRPDSLYTQMGFTQLRAVSPRGVCSPFDQAADGLVVGEGGGCFVLKRLDDARRDGDHIWGVIAGIGLSNDLEGGLLAPASEGQLRAMRAAYEAAGWRPNDVRLIECHATGTPVGDAVELDSYKRLWQWEASGVCQRPAHHPDFSGAVLGSVKSSVGHLLTGAGAAALTKVLFALNEGFLPPTANFRTPTVGLADSPFRVLSQPEPWQGTRRAAVSSFGFGGINAHLLIERDDTPRSPAAYRGVDTPRSPSDDDLPTVAVIAVATRQISEPVVEVPSTAFRIPPREMEEMLPQQALLLLAARDAVSQADMGPNAGAFLGVSLDLNTTNFHLRWAYPDRADSLGPPLNANRTMGALASIAASRLAREFRIGGPCFTVSAGAASGLRAVELGVRAIQRGEIDSALVGAVDLRGDPREPTPGRSEAVVLILRRLDEARRDAQRVLATVGKMQIATDETDAEATTGLSPLTGRAGGTTIEFLPGDPPLAEERLFVVEGDLPAGLNRLRFEYPSRMRTGTQGRAVVLVARSPDELSRQIQAALRHLRERPQEPAYEGYFYSPTPLKGRLAFTYPGSGNDFPGMGRALLRRWPAVARRQRRESRRFDVQFPSRPETIEQRIAAQVSLGNIVSDVLAAFGVRPTAALGYSLGESAALFGLRAWADRDGLFDAMEHSSLFKTDLCGPCHAARRAWGVEQVDWGTAVVERSASEVRAALPDFVYLQFVHGPRECVVGGRRAAVQELARRLDCSPVWVPTTTTMHCPVAEGVADEYRGLHVWPVSETGVTFYSSAWGRAYDVSSETAADAILAQATNTVDFPRAIEAAYADGVRLFIEAGPGASVSRLVSMTLAGRPHLARSACVAGPDALAPLWRVLASLIVERVPVDLSALQPEEGAVIRIPVGLPFTRTSRPGGVEPSTTAMHHLRPSEPQALATPRSAAPSQTNPALMASAQAVAAVAAARTEAHAAFLRNMAMIQHTLAATIAQQTALMVRAGSLSNGVAEPSLTLPAVMGANGAGSVSLNREQCLAFGIGRIADVLGPTFAAIDDFPTRVRLPDEPLMLVDRVLSIEGEPLSLTNGRIVTEHDIRPGAWYLDAGRIPTCLAVESGQADLLLSGYLGIDLRTHGLAVYRLLDAAVTFHRSLPGPGDVIRYDIHIDTFFRQDETYLFRFRFVGTVNNEPLLTMSDGVAGFFTAEALAAGRGVVRTVLQDRHQVGVEPDDASFLPSMVEESYDEGKLDSLRRGELAACFGPLFAGLSLHSPSRLPGGRMRLVHRVKKLEPRGGRFGIGRIIAEADIHPDDWFLTCHFVDDQVMPGTLMFECCLHTLRIFLTRLGWIGEQDEVAYEPVPGVRSRLKCRGQVTAATRVVTYEVTIKERGYRPEPYAVVDALMYADGKCVVDIGEMSVRLTGLTRQRLQSLWLPKKTALPNLPSLTLSAQTAKNQDERELFTRDQILSYAVGNPSDCFGERYRAFDSRFLARLPGPPFAFLDRVIARTVEPFVMKAGGTLTGQYDVPPDAWYFASDRCGVMPFCVLLETALQVCGFTSCYLGSALTTDKPLHYRNLGGEAELLRDITPNSGTLTTCVKVTRVAASGGMIIQEFDFDLADREGCVYRGKTTFGFFSPQALAQQVGLREGGPPPLAVGSRFDMPSDPPFPDELLRMIDQVDHFDPAGVIEGCKRIRPEEWFFAAHFYQDPVWPGSLGLEALVQLFKVVAQRRWGASGFRVNHGRHRWTYRGQVLPTNREVQVRGVVTTFDDVARTLTGHGWLTVDGRTIYRMEDFRIAAR